MPFSFPSSPTVGQQSTQNGRVYQWNGSAWQLVATPTAIDGAAITTGTVAIARLPTPTVAQAINNASTVVSTPFHTLRQLKNWHLLELSALQRDITVSNSAGSVSTNTLALAANSTFANANASVVYRMWTPAASQYYSSTGQGAGGGATNWSWSKPLAVAFRVAIGGFFAATSTCRVQLGKKSVTTAGQLDQHGIGIEVRGGTVNVNGRLWILAHNGTTLTQADTGLDLLASPFYDILLTSDGAGNVSCWVNDTEYTTTGGPTTDLSNAASGSLFAVEALNGNTANGQTQFRVSRNVWVTAQ